ncbi:hypothetical protein CCACVL1_00902 [Corchorus capsularis]|uniref:Uncharacterized protein n=1 Tax=Corchorus capsularis TaxID=210143 RepID=A0A1R3KTV2_COCAP|nr:hypothetical protein CCACVL1_03329 [Corchorus capsularis]OMP10523.1 hypothetical protein CCACVL1_00902 [Corchorus capsularis]
MAVETVLGPENPVRNRPFNNAPTCSSIGGDLTMIRKLAPKVA